MCFGGQEATFRDADSAPRKCICQEKSYETVALISSAGMVMGRRTVKTLNRRLDMFGLQYLSKSFAAILSVGFFLGGWRRRSRRVRSQPN